MTADLAHLRALLDKATPGQWKRFYAYQGRPWISSVNGHVADGVAWADAELITDLRNAAPALLDEVEALRARVALLERVAEAARDLRGLVSRDAHALCPRCALCLFDDALDALNEKGGGK